MKNYWDKYTTLFVTSFVFFAGVVLVVWHSYSRFSDFIGNEQLIAEITQQSASKEIQTYLNQINHSVNSFALSHLETIHTLSKNPDRDSKQYLQLKQQIQNHFPQSFSFAIADKDGNALLEDSEGLIGAPCSTDIFSFASDHNAYRAYLHRNPKAVHFDVMTQYPATNGEVGIFFITFKTDIIKQILLNHTTSRHELLLVREDQPSLIEISSTDSRGNIKRAETLSSEEIKNIHTSGTIPGTRWKLTTLPDLSYISEKKKKLAIETLTLVLFVVMLVIVLSAFSLKLRNKALIANKRYEQLFRQNTNIELIIDPVDGKVVDANRAATTFYGYPLDKLTKMNISQINLLSDEKVDRERHHAESDGREYIQLKHRLSSGEIRDVKVSTGPFYINDATMQYMLIQDVTHQRITEDLLYQEQLRTRTLIENMPVLLFSLDLKGTFTLARGKGVSLLKKDPVDIIGENIFEVYADFPAILNIAEKAISGIKFSDVIQHDQQYFKCYFNPVFENEQFLNTVGLVIDITDQVLAEQDKQLAAIAFEAQEAIVITDQNSIIMKVNTAFTEITGYLPDEVLGKSMNLLKSGVHDKTFYKQLWQEISEKGSWHGEIINRKKKGTLYTESLTIHAVKNNENEVKNYVAHFQDISKVKNDMKKLEQLASYDELTGLPNRRFLAEHLNTAITNAQQKNYMCALMLLDVDHFKIINDSLGHDAGDKLLKEITQRLLLEIGTDGIVARMGGDEFVILIQNIGLTKESANKRSLQIAENMRDLFFLPVVLDENEHQFTCSIGITLFPNKNNLSNTPADLFKQIDTAMHLVKESGRDGIHFFSRNMQEIADHRLRLNTDLRSAIKSSEFELYYQPQVDNTGKIRGAEALIRWPHTEGIIAKPNSFIPIAEETGLILSLGDWVLLHACKQLRKWEHQNVLPEQFRLAVNVSIFQFKQDDFVDRVQQTLSQTGINPKNLKLELTESALAMNPKQITIKMQALKNMGIELAIDDFGTGYSSLNYLRTFPIDQLKIDQSFVRNITSRPTDAAIADTIIDLAHHLNLQLIAEGVESISELRWLEQKGCTVYQGYLFSKPVPVNKFTKMFNTVFELEAATPVS